jgi:hypothetical protein
MIGCGGAGRVFSVLPPSLSVLDSSFVIRKTGEEMSKSGFPEPSLQPSSVDKWIERSMLTRNLFRDQCLKSFQMFWSRNSITQNSISHPHPHPRSRSQRVVSHQLTLAS